MVCLGSGGTGGAALRSPGTVGRGVPLAELFCFARLRYLGEKAYVEFRFDEKDWPVFG